MICGNFIDSLGPDPGLPVALLLVWSGSSGSVPVALLLLANWSPNAIWDGGPINAVWSGPVPVCPAFGPGAMEMKLLGGTDKRIKNISGSRFSSKSCFSQCAGKI